MATIDAAANIRERKPGIIAALISVLGLALAGCSANGNLLDATTQQGNFADQTAPQQQIQPAKARVAVAPVIGAPETVAAQMATQLSSQLIAKQVEVVKEGQPSDYTLRGYMVAARERAGTKVSYIWDVTNPKGDRVNRITGEEIIRGSNSRDPWVAVSPQIIGQIANKTATSLGAWLPSQRPASSAPSRQPVATASPTPAVAAPTPVAARPLPSTPTTPISTASTNRGATTAVTRTALTVVQPRVTGAPGDGSISLARALSGELTRNGVALSPVASPATYKVTGKVAMGAPVSGSQAIQIDWIVQDPKGNKLGTVSQKNDIPAGSLNGTWGATADAAAGAAAQGILRLLREGKPQ